MIVPMKKVLLLTLKSDRDASLDKLREFGAVEVVSEALADSTDRIASAVELAALDRVIGSLSSRKASADKDLPQIPTDDKALLEYALSVYDKSEELQSRQNELRKEQTALAPWGEYDPALIAGLREQNIYVYLCESSLEQQKALAEKLENASIQVISANQGMCRFAVIAQAAITDVELPEVPLAERTLSAVCADMDELAIRQEKLEKELDALHAALPALKTLRGKMASDVELLSVRDGLSDCGQLVALRGFVPEPKADKLQIAARENAWALLLSDPEPGETVPILLEPPRWVKPVMPLFQFLGIAPGYEEFDMSPAMLIFFSIFFSMIINDAGYALIMLVLSVIAAVVLRKNPKAAMPCRLAIILSGCASAWGMISGSYFGAEVAATQLPFFASGSTQIANLQLICFVLALVHLSLGHCWQLVNAKSALDVIGQLGWIPILMLDFIVVLSLLVFPGMGIPAWALITGGVGFAMVLIGGVNWRDVSAICNLPFDLIGSFTDTLSYVRLFAVGLAGAYMAHSFNDMAMQLWDISPWLIPAAILVLLIGHLMNVALAFMSVFVHGVRLNTLEFSNHAGIRWGGQAFKPLKKFE